MNRVAQLQIDQARRPTEDRSFWPGFVLSLTGLLLALFGLGRITAVEKVSGDLALETEVNMAIAYGGVQFVVEQQLDPELELERLRQGELRESPLAAGPRGFPPGKGRLCIDLTSKEPCPT